MCPLRTGGVCPHDSISILWRHRFQQINQINVRDVYIRLSIFLMIPLSILAAFFTMALISGGTRTPTKDVLSAATRPPPPCTWMIDIFF